MRERDVPAGTDLLVAGAVAAIGQLDVWLPQVTLAQPVGARPVNSVGLLLTASALVWRRRAPLPVLAVIATVSSVQYLMVGASQGLGTFLPLLIALYSVGRYAERRALLVAGPVGSLALVVHESLDPNFEFGGPVLVFWLILAAAWPLGQTFRSRDLRAVVLTERAERLANERDEQARRAVSEERQRISRELHDVVGHGVSVVVVQAVAAAGLLDKERLVEARERVDSIERTARQALNEMRRLVGLLGEDEGDVAPQPGLDQLHALVDDVRRTGLAVHVCVPGALKLPPGLDLTVFRIVQEALTNVLKHAQADHARVDIGLDGDILEVAIRDDGVARAGPTSHGRGLVGMRQRAALYGGQIVTGPDAEGGFQVQVRIPLGEVPA